MSRDPGRSNDTPYSCRRRGEDEEVGKDEARAEEEEGEKERGGGE